MSFVSLLFLAYLVVVVFIHYLLPHKVRYIWLLAASYFFYGFANPWLLFLIIGISVTSYLCALATERFPKHKKLWLVLCLLVSLGCLFVFKYLDFAIGAFFSISHLFGSSWQFDALNIILPVGISFYTFQALSYVVDVYRGNTKAERHIGYFCLFISYFPQLVAGPIERFDRLMPQIKNERAFDVNNLYSGLYYVVKGYIKKVVLADFLAITVNAVYGDLSFYDGGAILLATVFFAFQIYGDFSGYSDIAKGASKMMGIDLMENFDSPYLATSPKDFWRRWHISLSQWFGDYVYVPLGGNRKGKFRQVLNLAIVFVLSGLWHGANVKFLVWGALHALYRIIEALLPRPIKPKKMWQKIIACFITFLLVDFAWIFFRADNLSSAALAISKIFTAWDGLRGIGTFFNAAFTLRLVLAFAALLLVKKMPMIQKEGSKQNEMAITSLLFGIAAIALSWTLLYVEGDGSAFIYFQF